MLLSTENDLGDKFGAAYFLIPRARCDFTMRRRCTAKVGVWASLDGNLNGEGKRVKSVSVVRGEYLMVFC